MTAPTLTLAQLKKLQPCVDAFERIAPFMGGKGMTAHEARAAGATFDNLVWVVFTLARTDLDVERRVRLWVADCAAHVLRFYERNYPADDRPCNAIKAARAFARGEVNDAVRSVAVSAATLAASDVWAAATWAENDAVWAASDAANAAQWAAAWPARDATWCATSDAANAAARDATWATCDAANATARDATWWATSDAARDAEEAWQFDRLIAWLGDQEPTDYPLPAKTTASKAA